METFSHGGTPVTSEIIHLEEQLTLPDIRFHAKRQAKVQTSDDPNLDNAHIHGDYELYLHLEGDGAFLVGNRLYPLRRGDVIFTRPNDVHVFVLQNPCHFDHICVWFSPSCGKNLFAFSHGEDFCPHLTFSETKREALISLLCRLCDKQTEMSEQERLSLILQASVILGGSRNEERPRMNVPPEMQPILDVIDAEFSTLSGIEELASRFGISTSTLGRMFRKHIHLSPHAFLQARRLSHAKKMLDGGATVTESCMNSGFSDCSYFISVFKRKFGETPFAYKKRISAPPQN